MSSGAPTASRFASPVRSALIGQVDIAWLAAFRALYGVLLCVSMLRFLGYGWVDRLFVSPGFQFKYWGFAWVEPLPSSQMHALFWGLAALALAVAWGVLFRLSAPLFALGLAYVQLLDVSNYLNHYYLAALLAFLLAVSPAHRAWSVDAWLLRRVRAAWGGRKVGARAQGSSAETVRGAWLYLFRFQVGVVYFFAGMAKANGDWLLHGQPLRIWLGANVDLPWVGPLLTIDFVPLLFSWFGFLFDTMVVAFLLFRRSRPWAYAVVVVFHMATRVLFPIGMFPVIMVSAALVFFPPSWPRALWGRVRARFGEPVPPSEERAAEPCAAAAEARASKTTQAAFVLGGAYCLVQLILPLRHLAYPGNVLWHEQGMRFSWRVMVRAKGGSTTFVVRETQTGRTWYLPPRTYLTGMQESEMSGQPDLILQLAHHIRDDFARRGRGPVEVRAESYVSLNGRRAARFIDPNVDLASVRDGLGRASFVLPAPVQAPPHTRPVL